MRYYIFNYATDKYESDRCIGYMYSFPSNNMGSYYTLEPIGGKKSGNIVKRIKEGDKVLLYVSGSSKTRKDRKNI